MKKTALIPFLLIVLVTGQLFADNRVMILIDSIPNSLDTVDIPFGYENDLASVISSCFLITTEGDVTARFLDAHMRISERLGNCWFWFSIFGIDSDTLTLTTVPIIGVELPPGPLDTIFYATIEIEGGYGEICIDSLSQAGPAGEWYWWQDGVGEVYPSFNNGNGPHCMPYYYLCGDPSRDMKVNVSDAVRIVSYVFYGTFTPDPEIAADTNCDGTVNVSDAVVIINYVFIGGYPPCDTNNDGVPDC